jgi:cell division protein FtsZ
MTLNLNVPALQPNLTPQITVIGVGGAGGNAVNNMIQSNLEGVDFLIANTDAQAIQQSLCDHNIQLGRGVTQGLGSGSKPDVGRAAAEEALDDILAELEGANMVFITAGMGGGTGTGGAPVIARAAREAGVLTVGVVTKPFHFEGVHRMRIAEAGITELTQYVDTLIVIPNQNLFRIANEKTTFADAFKMADDVLHAGVRGVTDLMVMPGLINLDFADIRSVMTEMGKAEGRARCADQHHRRPRHDPVRGRRDRQPDSRRGRPGSQHNLRLDLRSEPRGPDPGLRGGDRDRRRRGRPAAPGRAQSGVCPRWP